MNLTKRDDGSTGYPCAKGHEHDMALHVFFCEAGDAHHPSLAGAHPLGPEASMVTSAAPTVFKRLAPRASVACRVCGSETENNAGGLTTCVEDEAARAWQARRKTCRK